MAIFIKDKMEMQFTQNLTTACLRKLVTADHKIWNQIDHKNSVIQGVTPIKIGGCESLFGDELLTLDCVPKAIEDRQKISHFAINTSKAVNLAQQERL